jgi:hypothetical protein
MKTEKFSCLVALVSVMAAGLFTTGCKTIVRENIISSIDTGLGATLAENKQTQLYELKAGYIHSQFYSIPTGKMVENDGVANDTAIVTSSTTAGVTQTQAAKYSNAANITPQLVSGIKASTSLADVVVGMNISENFAVGDVAVNSYAASAMYISSANNTNSADAAAKAVEAVSQSTNSVANTENIIMQQQRAIINTAYQAAPAGPAVVLPGAATQGNFMAVISAVCAGKYPDMLTFLVNGTPYETSTVYNILKNQKLVK